MSDRRRRRSRAVAESPLSGRWRPTSRERAVLAGWNTVGDESGLEELAALADTAGAEVVGRLVQKRTEPDPATFLGRGKLDDLHGIIHGLHAGLVVFDEELTPAQLRNVEERLGVKVVDRTALILDIFSQHARSREGKAQVELAQLNYLLPRLRGWGEAMSRLGGGIGTRGPGETKLEVDRQHIKRRITKLRRDLAGLTRARRVKRAARERSRVPQISLVGYTNAGKSTLMNALTRAGVLVADQLFATLDPTVRRLKLPGGRRATLSDTVGFVRKLPHDLVEAFRSTLEEVTLASLVLHVADASAPDVEDQVDAVREVLARIGAAGIPEVLALNKADLLSEVDRARAAQRRFPEAVLVSAVEGLGLEELLDRVATTLPAPPVEVLLFIPYDRQRVVARLYEEAEVLESQTEQGGTTLRARVREDQLRWVGEFAAAPVRTRMRLPG